MSYSNIHVGQICQKQNIHYCSNVFFLYLYFLGLSLRNTSKALEPFKDQQRSHVSVWNWIQRFSSFHIYNKHRRVSAFIIDETVIQIGNQHFWLWICIEPIHKSVLGIYISQKREICL
jgi:putative transposase